MRQLIEWLINWPERVAAHLQWLAPLFARITVGWVFLLSGWGKLNNLPQVTENFIGWGIPFPHFFTPLTSGIEFFGGPVPAAGIAYPHFRGGFGRHHDRRHTIRQVGRCRLSGEPAGFDEFEYLALFLWLAIAGPGVLSLDHLLQRLTPRSGKAGGIITSIFSPRARQLTVGEQRPPRFDPAIARPRWYPGLRGIFEATRCLFGYQRTAVASNLRLRTNIRGKTK